MAQTTGALSARNATLEYSLDGSAWTLFSGWGNKIDGTNQARNAADAFTFDGDTAIVTVGKRPSLKIKVTAIYTEGGSDIQEIARARSEGALVFYLRWTIGGATTGNFRYATSAGYITDFPYPQADAASANAVVSVFTVTAPSVTKAVVP